MFHLPFSKTLASLSVLSFIGLSACTAGQPDAPPLPALTKGAPFTPADSFFLQSLNDAQLTTLSLAQAATTRAGRNDLSVLAAKMVKEQTESHTKLTALATTHTLTLASEPSAAHQALVKNTARLHGAPFDRAYSRNIVATYARLKPVLSAEIATSKNTDIVTLAQDTQKQFENYTTQIR